MHLEELRAQKKLGEDDPALLEEIGKAKLSLGEKHDVLLNELKTEWTKWDRILDAETENAGSEGNASEARRHILDKIVDILNRRNYIRNLLRDVNDAMEG
jgi:molecular chaperone HscB